MTHFCTFFIFPYKYSSKIIDPGDEREYVYIMDDEGMAGECIEKLDCRIRGNLVLHISTEDEKNVDLELKPVFSLV